MRNIDGRGIIRELLQRVPVPGATPFSAAGRGPTARGAPVNAAKVGALAIVILIAAQVSGWGILDTLFFVVVGVLIVAYVWSRVSLRSLALVRETRTDRAQVGQTLDERLQIENRGKLAETLAGSARSLDAARPCLRGEPGDASPAGQVYQLARPHALHAARQVHDRPADAARRRPLRPLPVAAAHPRDIQT